MFGKKKKQENEICVRLGEHEVYRGTLTDLPLKEEIILEKSEEFFNDPNPCFIHRSAVRVRLLAELEEAARPCATIEEWFRHIEEYTRLLRLKSMKRQEDREGVRLMTLHSAKGLEFDTVFLVEANEGKMPYKKAKTDAETEEERRLFYVGMTRAKEVLKVSYVKTKNGKETSPSRFVDELLE